MNIDQLKKKVSNIKTKVHLNLLSVEFCERTNSNKLPNKEYLQKKFNQFFYLCQYSI